MAITYEQVQGAIKAIQNEGHQASIRAIREHLGTGSLGTIHKYLHQPEPSPNPLQVEVGRLRLEIDQLRIEVDRLNLALVRPAGHETEPGHDAIHNAVTPAANEINEIIRQGDQAGLADSEIADRLNELGILTSKGNLWTSEILRLYAKRQGMGTTAERKAAGQNVGKC